MQQIIRRRQRQPTHPIPNRITPGAVLAHALTVAGTVLETGVEAAAVHRHRSMPSQSRIRYTQIDSSM
ncbi:hypothetical protein ACFVKB_47140 [Rhodococcus sp. NPDC127530]|uniref:hypothetical protein n=1 Tax=unclassified Rhodococcus (in: high G+C Gram-positive bacteria) TaxID=192944 RepID=UPI003636919F